MEYNHIPESMEQVGIFWIIDGDIAGYGLDSCDVCLNLVEHLFN